MQKLKYGDGSISPRQKLRKDGTIRRYYQGRIYIDGVQRSVYANTKAECYQKLRELREDKKDAPDGKQTSVVLPVSSSTTLGAWLDKWLIDFKKGNTKRKYYANLCRRVEKIKAALGNLKLKQVDSMSILEYLNSMPKNNSTAKIYGILKDSLQRAEDFGIIKKNPCKVIKKPKYVEQTRRPFELEEQNAILNALSDRYRAVFFFLCSTGLRIGEFLALTPDKVDFNRKCLNVTENQDLETKDLDTPKTAASVRKVYFADELFEHFDVESLGTFTYNAIKKAFSKVYKALGIEGVSATHSCRHTFASLLYAVRVPAKIIQDQCGHADEKTTMEIYTDTLLRGNSPIYNYILKLKDRLAERFQMW